MSRRRFSPKTQSAWGLSATTPALEPWLVPSSAPTTPRTGRRTCDGEKSVGSGCPGKICALRGAAVGGRMTVVAAARSSVAGEWIDPFTRTEGGLGTIWEQPPWVMWMLRRGAAAQDPQGLFLAAHGDSGAFPVWFLAQPGDDVGCCQEDSRRAPSGGVPQMPWGDEQHLAHIWEA